MADTLPATIITALLDDEATAVDTAFFLAEWATAQKWGHVIDIDADLSVTISMVPDGIIDENGYQFGDAKDDRWAEIKTKLVPWDGFGREGPAQARASAAKLRELADQIDASAAAGECGREDAE